MIIHQSEIHVSESPIDKQSYKLYYLFRTRGDKMARKFELIDNENLSQAVLKVMRTLRFPLEPSRIESEMQSSLHIECTFSELVRALNDLLESGEIKVKLFTDPEIGPGLLATFKLSSK